jgi:hypothetical protein
MPTLFSLAERFHTKPPAQLERWGSRAAGLLVADVFVVVFGTGLYGYSLGCWRSAEMGIYVAVKLPLLIFLTLGINGLLNGILAQLLGSGLGFRQTLRAQLSSFSLFALIVGALSPITLGMVWEAPPPSSAEAARFHATFLVLQTAVIAYAGVTANFRLLVTLEAICQTPAIARRVLFSWLAGNLFVGAQLSYILRPFFGSPRLEVAFLREDALQGNFYETIWRLSRFSLGPVGGAAFLILCFFIIALCFTKYSTKTNKPHS